MALRLRRSLPTRLFSKHSYSSSPSHLPTHPAIKYLLTLAPNAAANKADLLSSSTSTHTGFSTRFLHPRFINIHSASLLPEFLNIPVGGKLREKLKSLNANISGDRFRLDGLVPPPERADKVLGIAGWTTDDARKILRTWQMEKVKSRLREMPVNSMQYEEYVRVCSEATGDHSLGQEIAQILDQCGNVIILGSVVFIRPDQVVKSVEKIIREAIAVPNDPRRKELEEMEKQKARIDEKAESQVKAELYSGLGFIVVQTVGLMRLTFWELSWDVMEPICFFVTSLHFALAYGFFLRTSKEPSFEGYFQRRFKSKQRKLMKLHRFDMDKYSLLCRAFHPPPTPAAWN